jgi:hypothetical protein
MQTSSTSPFNSSLDTVISMKSSKIGNEAGSVVKRLFEQVMMQGAEDSNILGGEYIRCRIILPSDDCV